MSTFHLQIVTPKGLFFDGNVQKVITRAVMGDVCILSGHSDFVTPISRGAVKITADNGDAKQASCSGGFLSVKKDVTRIVSDGFEWTEG